MTEQGPVGLGLDCGGSASRWVLRRAENRIAAGTLPPVSGHLFRDAERERFAATTNELARSLPPGATPDRVVAGITGLSATAPEARLAAALIANALRLPADRVAVEDDVWIAYHAAFTPGEGHVVYAGTGSIGIHVRGDGSVVRVGGRGMLIDDAGSGFWIGRRALALVWRERDDDPDSSSPLADALFAAIGSTAWDDVRAHVYGGGRDAVAQLARAVAAAAEAGDAAALELLIEAGRELARLARALARRAGHRPVALLGRAAQLHPVIFSAMHDAASPLTVAPVVADASDAAARLAVTSAGSSRPCRR